MIVTVTVLDVRGKGVQVALDDESDAFWLPRAHPAVHWSAPPDVGEHVTVTLPVWLIHKHEQLVALRHQRSLAFHQPAGFDPAKEHGALPMADNGNEGRGALFRVPDDEKKNDKWPDMRGDIVVEGRKWKLAGWTKTDKNGRKYLSLVAKPDEQRQEQPRTQSEPRNTYADAKQGRGGPTFADRDEIPFGPEWR